MDRRMELLEYQCDLFWLLSLVPITFFLALPSVEVAMI